VKILTCNIRGAKADDGPDNWRFRKEICAEVIARQKADVICFQEMTCEQRQYLESAFPDYSMVCALDKPATGHPRLAVIYRSAAFKLRASGAYWLSETPHVPGSKSWQSDCIRYLTWAHWTVLDGGWELRVLNTHLDHVSQQARENQARLINEDAAAYPHDFPQILTGDMNSDGDNPAAWSYLSSGWQDSWQEVHGPVHPGPTSHGFFHPDPLPTARIDWILLRGPIRATEATVIRDSIDGRNPSDHYFVSATVRRA
jgi:endonuclease/exonuclease/phosphatase family metal-dependent hydrolase